jgi:hypothetical protein
VNIECFSAKRYQHDGSRFSSSLVEHWDKHRCPDSQGSACWSSAPGIARLLVAARLWCLSRSHLQSRGIRLIRGRPWHLEHDHCSNRSVFCLCFFGEESSGIWSRCAERSKQARDDRDGVLRYLDDLYDDSTLYCSKSASFLAGSFFSSAGGVGGLAVDGLFMEDRSVT